MMKLYTEYRTISKSLFDRLLRTETKLLVARPFICENPPLQPSTIFFSSLELGIFNYALMRGTQSDNKILVANSNARMLPHKVTKFNQVELIYAVGDFKQRVYECKLTACLNCGNFFLSLFTPFI